MKYKCTYNHRATNTSTVFYTNNLRGAFARVPMPDADHAMIVGCWNGNGIVIEY